MKLLTVSVILLLSSVYASAQVKWDGGGGDGLWENPLNWDTDMLPIATDDILLDNSLLAGNYTVTLPVGAVNTTVNTLAITPTGASVIRLIIPAGNTENAALSVTGPGDALILNNGAILQNSSGTIATGSGISITNTFRINNGGRYIHNTSSDNNSIVSQLSSAVGTETGIFEYDVPVTTNYEISAAGQTYGTLILSAVASGSSNYTISSGSTPVTIHGDFRVNGNAHFINSSSTDITVDGNLQMQNNSSADLSGGVDSPVLSVKGNFANAGTITESGTGNPKVLLNGTGSHTLSVTGVGTFGGDNLDFIVNTTGTIRMTTNVNLPHSLFVQAGTIDVSDGTGNYSLGVKGNLQVQGTITESGTGSPRITLNGTSNQNITVSGGGSITGDQLDFRLSNPAGATLLSDLVLPYHYTIAGGNLTLGNFSLTTTFVSQSAPILTNHIITNGTGFLIIPNVGATLTTFPVGVDATTVNSIDISNGGGLTYYVRVGPGITPDISNPLIAIDRTWTINTNGVPPSSVTVTFFYYTGQGQAGFDYAAKIDVGQYASSAWNLISNNKQPTVNVNEYRIVTTINSFNTPFIIGNHGAILPIDFFIVCSTEKKGNNGVITWNVGSDESVQLFEVEKSTDNSAFKSVASFQPGIGQLDYTYNDNDLTAATNLYRIKTTLLDGKVKYSNTAAILHKSRQVLITAVAPNPVQGTTRITISSPVKTSMRMVLYDMQGRAIKQWQQSLSEGTNTVSLQMDNFRSGIYFLSGADGNIKTNQMRVVKQ